MTQIKAKFQYYAALVGWLIVMLAFRDGRCTATAQDLNTNEVLPSPLGSSKSDGSSSSRIIVCPKEPPGALARLLGVACEKSADCRFLSADRRCCRGVCRPGVEPPIYEPPHGDVLGIRRKCPLFTFPERLPIRRCSKDADCEGLNRICCPDKKDKKLYCRTAAPLWSEIPFINNKDTLNTLVGFVQCQQPPPPLLDIFSHPCNTTIECLPNLCCQEGSKKVCRPPKRSVLSLAVQATAKFIKG